MYDVHVEANDEHRYYKCKVHDDDDDGRLRDLRHVPHVHVLRDDIQNFHDYVLDMSKDNVREDDEQMHNDYEDIELAHNGYGVDVFEDMTVHENVEDN